jgi:iron-sulfur cluster assembly protein
LIADERTPDVFSVTPTASQEILAAASRSDAAGMALRVAARQVADGSIEYGMGFDEPREGDLPLQLHGVDVLIAPPSQPMLDGVVLDFVEIEPGNFNFIFVPEDAAAEPPAKACGSGGCSGCSA